MLNFVNQMILFCMHIVYTCKIRVNSIRFILYVNISNLQKLNNVHVNLHILQKSPMTERYREKITKPGKKRIQVQTERAYLTTVTN